MGGILIAYNKIPHSLKSLDTDFSRFSSDPQTSQDCSPTGVATILSMTVACPSPPMIHAAFIIAAFRLQLVISPQHGPQHAATSLEFTFPVYLCPSQFQKDNSLITLGFSTAPITRALYKTARPHRSQGKPETWPHFPTIPDRCSVSQESPFCLAKGVRMS